MRPKPERQQLFLRHLHVEVRLRARANTCARQHTKSHLKPLRSFLLVSSERECHHYRTTATGDGDGDEGGKRTRELQFSEHNNGTDMCVYVCVRGPPGSYNIRRNERTNERWNRRRDTHAATRATDADATRHDATRRSCRFPMMHETVDATREPSD